MPRATRAALRAQEHAEEAATAALVALPPTPSKERVPLGEISNNVNTSIMMEAMESLETAEKLPAPSGKKGKGGKKGKKITKAKPKDQDVEILEDENQSSQSDAVEQACTDLQDSDAPAVSLDAMIPDNSDSPPSPAAEAASEKLSSGRAPDFELDTLEEVRVNGIGSKEPIFQQQKSSNGDDSDSSSQPALKHGMPADEDDSFVEQIKTRTPAKRVSRIEDSVEALDAFEDEIEKVGEAIPAAASDRSSPLDVKKRARNTNTGKDNALSTPKNGRVALSKPLKGKIVAGETKDEKVKTKRQPNISTNKTSARPKPATAHTDPASTRKVSQVNGSSSAHPPKRVSSIHKAPFQPVKSAKPPTKSNFELPGEAVARKLKEQREERQKREEEEQSKTKQAKPKPIRHSHAPEIKLNAAAKARLGLAQNAANENATPTSASFSSNNKRSSSATIPPKPIPQATRKAPPISANSSARRGPSTTARTASRQVSTSSPPRPPPTAADIAQQKLKGKDAYQRSRGMLSEKEKEKKAKEEAAKKARIDAAERGRIASREWAEKQKAKKAASQTTEAGGDNGTSASRS